MPEEIRKDGLGSEESKYDKESWQRIPEYGRFQQRKSEEMEITFAPLFLSFLFRIKGGEKLLDVACGAGSFAYFLEKERVPVSYTGFDITPCYLEMARERFPQHTWVDGDARKMPFEDQQFDFTFCVNLLQHLDPPDVQKVLMEMKRVTKKAIFIQSDFDLAGRKGSVKSGFAEPDGTVTTFVYNFISYKELESEGWQWYRVADEQMLIYMVCGIKGREHEYVILERT